MKKTFKIVGGIIACVGAYQMIATGSLFLVVLGVVLFSGGCDWSKWSAINPK
jgi:hypothetical protein